MSQRRKFDQSFKKRAVELSYKRENIRELSEELGVNPDLIYRWRKEFNDYDEGCELKHLLWAWLFLKTCDAEPILAGVVGGVNEKTFQK